MHNQRLIISGLGRSGTTPTQRILNGCDDVWVTNEFCLYDYAYGSHPKGLDTVDPSIYFNSLVKNKQNIDDPQKYNYIDPPPEFNLNTFSKICYNKIKKMKNNSAVNRITVAEQSLFGNRYRYYGDKIVNPETLNLLFNDGLKFKLIYVFRDGRDNVTSRILRQFPKIEGESRDKTWANYVFRWMKFKKKLNASDYIEIKFEDFKSDKNAIKLSGFLGLDLNTVLISQNSKFDLSRAHIGHYKEHLPDWQESFCDEAKEALDILGYI